MADSTETRRERRASARAERDRAAAAARARQRQRLWVIGGALVIAVVVVAAIAIASGGSSKPKTRAGESVPGQIESNALFNGIPQNGITLGDPRAPVTMVEFADLQCPFCRQYTEQSLSTLVTDYVRTGKVKMIFRNVAFIGPDSLTAARMAAAAGMQNKLWTFIDVFYTNQQEEGTGYVTDAFLRRIASGVNGLNIARAMSDRNLPSIVRELDEAQTQWTSNGFDSTPSFLIGPTGGRLNALNITSLGPAQFTAALDKAIASAPRAG